MTNLAQIGVELEPDQYQMDLQEPTEPSQFMFTESGIENEATQPTDFNGLNLTNDEPVTATEAAELRHKAANGGKTTALIDFMPQTEITGVAEESMPDSAEGIIADPI